METPRKFIIAELSIRKLGFSSVLIILKLLALMNLFIGTEEDPSLRIESSAIINYVVFPQAKQVYCIHHANVQEANYIVFTMQTYKKPIIYCAHK